METNNNVNQDIIAALSNISERKLYEEALTNIAEGVSATVGDKFFISLAEHLARVLSANYAYIATTIKDKPNHVKTLSLIADGNIIENIEVNLDDTPCETILEKNICTYPSGVQKKFPKALMMAKMHVEGYAGKLLYSSSQGNLGLMAVMYRKPIQNVAMVESMLRIFASRAAAELERELSEEARRESEGKWRIITENSPDIILVIDHDYKILFLNRTISGTKESVIGNSIFEFVSEKSRKVMKECFDRVFKTGKPDEYETDYLTTDGKIISFNARVGPITHSGKVETLIISSTDISERKQMLNMLHIQRDISIALSGSIEQKEALSIILDAAMSFDGMDCGGIYLYDSSSEMLDLIVSKDLSDNFLNNASHYENNSDNIRLILAGNPMYIEYKDLPI